MGRFAAFFLMVLSFVVGQSRLLAGGNDAVLLFFTSSTSAPSQTMLPIVSSLEREGVPVRRVEVSQEPYLVARYGVRSTPTFIVLVGSREVTRLTGVQRDEQLNRALQIADHRSLVTTGARTIDKPILVNPKLPVSEQRHHLQHPRDLSGQDFSKWIQRQTIRESEQQSDWSELMPSRNTAIGIEKARSATVRLRVYDPTGYGIGTGTIIDSRESESLVLTCGHLFRDAGLHAKVEVDVFHHGEHHTVPGRLIDFDSNSRDIALVAIRPRFQVASVKIRDQKLAVRSGDSVFTFGCNRGEEPSRIDTRITGVNKYNQHLGLSNLEVFGAPIDGRSGGGLFDQNGYLIGVCNAADYRDNVGIYAALGVIRWQLERIGMTYLIGS